MTKEQVQEMEQEAVEEVVAEAASAEEVLKGEMLQWKDKAMRLAAEMENLRKRTEKEVKDAREYAVTSFARELLTVQDNMERTMESIEKLKDNEEVKPLAEGVKMVSDQLHQVFNKAKIEKINAVGEKMNPELHQVMMQVPSTDVEAGTIVQEMQAGYTISGRLLRPSLVGTAVKA